MHPEKKNLDFTLLIIVLALVIFGLVTLQSTSAYNGSVRFLDAGYYFKKQLFATALGLAAMGIISRMDYHIFSRFAVWGYLTTAQSAGCPWDRFRFSPRSLQNRRSFCFSPGLSARAEKIREA